MRILLLSGAGISAESGLKTFRDNDGLWENHRVEDVATPEAFARDPQLVHRFYNLRRAALADVRPIRRIWRWRPCRTDSETLAETSLS
ncbi:hypothetical protein GCM10007854_18350 [Algimonas porphyrae]|uniref:protein acetyllysine N-acetyltransferase n=1 Tax=Algimonas porphyrae TaxID=1128113 RepID=A0ABQ5V013_9PROT|nr:Sir2 family NAD-dependent protein deacetylase [Algimonas porphyrae]GLQ20880.1 hypothetical protein GCM10007854_18350 [Algimonas porphyrae]